MQVTHSPGRYFGSHSGKLNKQPRWSLCEVLPVHEQPQLCNSSTWGPISALAFCRNCTVSSFSVSEGNGLSPPWPPLWVLGAVCAPWLRSFRSFSGAQGCHSLHTLSLPRMPPACHLWVTGGRWRRPCPTPHDGALQQGTRAKWLSQSCLAPYPVIMIKTAKVKCFMVADLR